MLALGQRRHARNDRTTAARVRTMLDWVARTPALIAVTVEHGCVELRGPIATDERARVIRDVARVKGVDAVVDLLTEPERDDTVELHTHVP